MMPLCTALLHDTIEDTSKSFRDVSNLFGPEIANSDGVTKLSNLELLHWRETSRKFPIDCRNKQDLGVSIGKACRQITQ